MAALIGALRVDLSANVAAFVDGMKRAAGQAQKSASAISKSFGSIKTAAAGFATGVSVAAITAVTKKALDYASSLGEVAQQLGVTTKELQEYRYAATQAGISQEEMDKALAKLTQTMGKARTGAEGPKKAFDELSKILGKDILKNAKTAGDAIPMIADALAKVRDPAKRAAVEVALFGKAGQKLDTLLAGGSAGINNLRDAAHRLGIVLSDDQIQKADETADRLADLKQVLEARIAGVVADNAQSILSLANAFAELTTQIIRFNAQNPQVALGLIGAYFGGRFGPIGAAVGGVAGLAAGGYVERKGRDNNMDPSFRAKEYRAAQSRLAQMQQAGMDTRPARAEVLRQAQLMLRASRSGITPSSGAPASPAVADPNINLGGNGGGKKDNSAAEAERKRKDALRDQHQNDMDIARAQMDELRARDDLAIETQDKAQIAKQQLDLEEEVERKQIKFDQDMGDITAKQAEERQLAQDRIFSLRRQKLNIDEDEQTRKEILELERGGLELQLDRLQLEANLASTARERREVEMRILDARLALERQALQDVIDSKTASAQQKQEAERRKLFLDRREPLMREGVRRETEGPLERYMRTLPNDANKLDEALQNVAVSGLGSIEDGILDVINGTKSLAAAFRDMAQSIISDLLRIAIQRSITIPLANALFGGGSSGIMSGPTVSGGGGILGSLLKIGGIFAGSISGGGAVSKAAGNFSKVGMGLKGFASGGAFQIGGRHGYDTNLLSLNGQPIARVSRGETMGIIPGGANDPRRMSGGNTFNITVPGGGTREERRQTALQVGAEVRRVMTDSTRKGA